MISLELHNAEMHENLQHWERKPLLRSIYREFYTYIAVEVDKTISGEILELGSGIGSIKELVPECIRTDIFPNPWLDRTENAYKLTVRDGTVSNIILFDVFHHLRHPGTALDECRRALAPEGKLIIFDPCLSILGALVYRLFHHEPIALFDAVEWRAPQGWSIENDSYYAAMGNASRVFGALPLKGANLDLSGWKVSKMRRFAALSYVLSGGYGAPQLYPASFYPCLKKLDKVLDLFPWIFATRLLVVLERL